MLKCSEYGSFFHVAHSKIDRTGSGTAPIKERERERERERAEGGGVNVLKDDVVYIVCFVEM